MLMRASGGRVLTEERIIDGFAGVFESMDDEFGVGGKFSGVSVGLLNAQLYPKI
jgi:hypothetical protein